MQEQFRLVLAWDEGLGVDILHKAEQYFEQLGIEQVKKESSDHEHEIEYKFEGTVEGFNILKKSAIVALDLISGCDFRIAIYGNRTSLDYKPAERPVETTFDESVIKKPLKEEVIAKHFSSSWADKFYPEFVKFLINKYGDRKFTELCYLYYNGLEEPPKCSVCGGPVGYGSFNTGYKKYCSGACAAKSRMK